MPVFKPRHRSLLLGLALLYQPPAGAQVPSGGNVVGGSATIGAPSGGEQLITQTSSKAIIDWQNFSIGAGNSVVFKQPDASSVVLNRVIGNTASSIDGALSANGQVFLVNQAGVYFGAGARLDVGGLLASTLDIGNDDFMAGRYLFSHQGSSAARREVINAGVLKAREGGYVVLAGDYAANQGVIQARLGTVALAAGERMTLDIAGDSLINFAVNEKTVAELSGVENSGQLLADGGRAIMTAAVARDLATTVVNNSGLVQARAAEERDGAIYLSADGGNTLVSGQLDASGLGAGQKGGTIQVTGDRVALVNQASIDASGAAGGGTVNIGGGFQGSGPLLRASTAFVGKDVSIKADATENGDGGQVVVWSDDYTRFYGSASSRGGAQGGDGGMVEVSGKDILDYNGSVNTLAAKGKAGTLLLDPADIEIVTSVDPATADMTGSSPFSDATNNGGTSRITVGAVEAALAGGNVTVTTKTASGTAPKGGTITIDDGSGGGLQWSSANTLKLEADNQILIKSHVQGGNGTLWLDAAGGAVQSAGTNITADKLLITGGGNWDLGGVGSSGALNSFNDVNTFAGNINGGLLRYSSNRSFTLGTVNGVSGLNHTNGNTQLYIDRNGGALTLAQGINSGSIYMRAAGGVNQTGGSITANELAVVGGAASLTRSGNNLGSIAASVNGAFSYTDTNALRIGSVFGVNGITTNNGNVTLVTGNATGFDPTKPPDPDNATVANRNPASLNITQSINAGTGQISLTAGNGGVYQRHDLDTDGTPLAAGSLTARSLVLRGNDANNVTPFILNNAKNRVDNLAARANGTIAYTGGPLTVGSVDGINGITTTANTIVVPAGTDSSGRATPAVYNDDNISLSIGGNLSINQDINATSANGAGSVSIGMGGNFLAQTAAGKRINAKTLGVFGDDMQGTFRLTTNVQSLAAGGGKVMVIDNSAFTGELTAIGIGAPAADVSASDGDRTVDIDSASRPVGDFYLTAGGKLNIIKLISKGKNLMLRANSLDILLDAATADGARIMLQPYNPDYRIGVHNASDSDFVEDINYSADLLKKFTNPTATFFVGTAQTGILNDPTVESAAKTYQRGDIHIGSDGAFNLGYRSLSAQSLGSIVVHNAGPLYNLRLQAPKLTIYGFDTFGDQIHLFTNHLSLPSAASRYVNANRPQIVIRSVDDNTVWIGNGLTSKPWEPNFPSATLVKLPDYSDIIISGTTDHPFPAGGPGYGDIHIPWDDSIGVSLGNRKLTVSTGHTVYRYTRTPTITELHDGGKSGGLWQGCQNLTTCAGTNPGPIPDSDSGGGGSTGGNDGGGNTSDPADSNPDDCPGCPPADKNTDPYPPDTPTGGNDDAGAGDGGSGDTGAGDGSGGDGDSGGDGGAGTGGGGAGDGGAGDGAGGAGDGDGGAGTGADGSGDGDGGAGSGGDGGGDGGAGTGGGGAGDGGAGDGAGGAGDGDAGAGTGADGAGDGDGGAGSGGDGGGDGGAGTGGGGAGDGGAGDGSGGTGGGDGGAGDGTGTDGAGNGSGGAGDGSGGDGGGDGGAGTGGGGAGDGGAGDGSGGTGDGDGGAGDGTGADGAGDGSDGAGDGSGGTGDGSGGDGGGDGGAGTGGGGAGDGGAGDGSGGTGDGDGGAGDGTGTDGAGDGTDGADDGSGGDGGGDGGAGTGGGGAGDGSAGDGSGGAGDGDGSDGAGDGNTGDGGGDSGAGDGSGGAGDGNDGAGDGGTGDGDAGNGAGDGSTDSGTGADGTGDDSGGTGDGSAADGDGDSGAGTGSGGSGDDQAGTGSADDGNGVNENSSADDGAASSESGDAGSATGNGDTGEDGDAGNGSGNDADSPGDGSMASVRLDCADVAPGRQEKKGTSAQQAQRDLIEVKQDGIKMRNPCQQQALQDDSRK